MRLVRLDHADEQGEEGRGLLGRKGGEDAGLHAADHRHQALAQERGAGVGEEQGVGAAVGRRGAALDEAEGFEVVHHLPGRGLVAAERVGEALLVDAGLVAEDDEDAAVAHLEAEGPERLVAERLANLEEAPRQVGRGAVGRGDACGAGIVGYRHVSAR
jgi:hypothetical protein